MRRDGHWIVPALSVPVLLGYLFPMGWHGALIGLIVLLVLMSPFVFLYARRRWLTGLGGVFDCAWRIRDGVPGSGWVLGFARYRGEQLEWFRAMSMSPAPSMRIQRGVTAFVNQRVATGLDAVALFDDSRIVSVKDRVAGTTMELAIDRDSTTGLISWLESAPPGSHYLPGSADSPR